MKEQKQVYIIAEMSANHCGDTETAKKLIHAAKQAGADCVKLQTYTPDTLTIDCDNQYFTIDGGLWEGENLYSLYKRAYTPWEWHYDLKQDAQNAGIDFLSTAYDKTSVDFLCELDIPAFKIASFELVDIPFLQYAASKGKPMILSTGMATLGEIEEAVNAIKGQGNQDITLLKCASAYPASVEEMNLSTIPGLQAAFSLPVGLSDHSVGSLAAMTAVALGARVVEKHICLDRDSGSPDAAFSMTPEDFRKMVDDVRMVEKSLGQVQYGPTAQEVQNVVFRRSIFVVKDIPAGEPLTDGNIAVIRPGYGLHPKYWDAVLGQRALRDLKKGEPLSFGMFGGL